jgi:transcriptional regulator with XRE-family HTH domain
MLRRTKHQAPEGFVALVQEAMAKRRISLNQLAKRGGISAAFLSRILNGERSLPSDRKILRLARILDLAPAEQLLVAAGRIPEGLKPLMPALLRATDDLSETEMHEVMRTLEATALKQRRNRKQNEPER